MAVYAVDILLAGVGGQGIILASGLLAELGIRFGLDAKTSEVRGMSQREGSVQSHVRLGPRVLSPLIPRGQADFAIAMEEAESLRYLDLPGRDATWIVSTQRIIPPSVTTGQERYPAHKEIQRELHANFGQALFVDVPAILARVENPRTANLVLLGCLSGFLPFPEDAWRSLLQDKLPPKLLEANLHAFAEGQNAAEAWRKNSPPSHPPGATPSYGDERRQLQQISAQ